MQGHVIDAGGDTRLGITGNDLWDLQGAIRLYQELHLSETSKSWAMFENDPLL